jgi:hypothetical protein
MSFIVDSHDWKSRSNWKDSRWDYTKQRSSWHFDTSRPPEHGTDSYTFVCNFNLDFTKAIEYCIPLSKPSSWSTQVMSKTDAPYEFNAEQQDLIRAGANPDQMIFDRLLATNVTEFRKINEYLGMENSALKFHNQRTGQMIHTHLDNLNMSTELEFRRFAIMLSDWQLGQVFQLGNAIWSQWKAGDCITWDWKNMPHSSCNMGWWDRPMLQLTGSVTDITRQRLSEASKEKIADLTYFPQ